MKKFMMMVAMAFATLTASAQAEAGTLTLKPFVGMNLANVTKLDGDMKVGVVAGAELGYQATDAFAVTAGVAYSMQGSKAKNNDVKLKMDYLNIPILANYYVVKGLAIKAGVQPGFLLSSKLGDADIKDGCKKFDLSIRMGLSYEISDFVIDARYNLGLTKSFKGDDVEGTKHSVIQITLGYKFAL